MSKPLDPSKFGRPMGTEKLDSLGCAGCGQTHDHAPMEIMGKCHPDAGTRCGYQQGILYIACRECDKPVAAIVVGLRISDA